MDEKDIAYGYYRVSTKRQERSGLGLDAQQLAVRNFAREQHLKLAEEVVERRSGMRRGNPELSYVLDKCRKQKAVLLIAKLDRLKRNVAFIATLMESSVRFITVDDPTAEEFTQHIKAAVGQKEGRDISKRTTDALAAAKARGAVLGRYGREVLSKKNHELSCRFAQGMRQIIAQLKKAGFYTVRAITCELNRRHVPTYRHDGSKWHLSTVFKVMQLLKQHKHDQP